MVMLTDMADVLRGAGLTVVEHPDWKSRTQTDGGFDPVAVMIHHDASRPGPTENMPAYLADTKHAGSQLWVSFYGVWVTIAAGRMWHAGLGPGNERVRRNQGNRDSIGVETDHTTGEPWGPGQLDSLTRGTRALVDAYGWPVDGGVTSHKEYAPGRKVDPDIDMDEFRDGVRGRTFWDDVLPIPNPGYPDKRVLRYRPSPNTMFGEDVKRLQKHMNAIYPTYSKLRVDGYYGVATRAVIRNFQQRAGLLSDGIVGPATWARLGNI